MTRGKTLRIEGRLRKQYIADNPSKYIAVSKDGKSKQGI